MNSERVKECLQTTHLLYMAMAQALDLALTKICCEVLTSVQCGELSVCCYIDIGFIFDVFIHVTGIIPTLINTGAHCLFYSDRSP